MAQMLAVTNEFITSLNSGFGLYVQKLDKGQHRIINSTSVSGVIIHVTDDMKFMVEI